MKAADQIGVQPNLVLIDYDKPATWVNSPAPVDTFLIQEALTRVGGTIPPGFGSMSGKPSFIIVYGQTHKTFLNGKIRLMFDDKKLDARHLPNHYAVTQEVYDRAVLWWTEKEKIRQAALMRCDWKEAQNYPDVAAYIETRESSLDYKKLAADASPQLIARMMPPGWRYIAGLMSYEEIGEQCFYVLQWMSPKEFGSESDWAENRYAYTYLPETDTDENLVDVCGPYPYEGAYDHPVIRIADRVGADTYAYREPTLENVIPPLQELLEIRNTLSDRKKSLGYRNQQRIDQSFDEMAANREKGAAEFKTRFDDAKPVGKGNPVSLPTVKVRDGVTKHGKGEKR